MNTCIIIRCCLSHSPPLYRSLSPQNTYSLLLMGNVRTRTTACFPIIAINGSIHVCTRQNEKAITTKWAISILFNSTILFSKRTNSFTNSGEKKKKEKRRRRNEVCCFQVIASLRLHLRQCISKTICYFALENGRVCELVALDTFFRCLVCEESNKIFHFLQQNPGSQLSRFVYRQCECARARIRTSMLLRCTCKKRSSFSFWNGT